MPFLRKTTTAWSRSPFASWSALRQSIIGASVFSRSSLTCAAEIFSVTVDILLQFLCWPVKRPWFAPLFRWGSISSVKRKLERSLCGFRLVDSGDHTWGLADSSPKRSFQIDYFAIARRIIGAGLKTGHLNWSSFELFVSRDPSLTGALVAGHLHAFNHRVRNLGGKKTNRAQRVVVPRDDVVDYRGVAIR